MADRKLEVRIVGDARDLERAFGRASRQASGFGRAMHSASLVAIGAFAGIGIAAKIGFDEVAESQKVAAQTAAAIKSTGGAANVTAKQVTELAESLSGMSGVDDELIQSGENLLLTFTSIRNEVGKGNDIFNQATVAITDMSVALGQDMKSSALQLGKALNDPIRGMTALRRVGVQFTRDQETQIKALVKTGDTLGAQKLILAEITREFGGSAKAAGETLPGQLAKARIAFEEMTAELLSALLPALTSLAKIVAKASALISEHADAARVLIGVVAGLSAAVLTINVGLKLYAAAAVVARAATAAWTAVQWLLNAALTANPIGVVIVAVAALTAAIIVAWKTSETFRNVVTGAFNAVKTAAVSVLDFFRNNWPIIATLISGPFAPLVALATNAFGVRSALIGAFQAIIDKVGDFIDLVKWIGAQAGAVLGKARDKIVPVVYAITAAFGPLATIVNAIKAALEAVINAVGRAAGAIRSLPSLPDITPGFDIPGIPGMATGGIVRRPTLALLGEAGPEAVVPLDRYGGGTTVHVHVAGSVVSERDLIDAVHRGLLQKQRRNTSLGLA